MRLHTTNSPLEHWYSNLFFLIDKNLIIEILAKNTSDLKQKKPYNGSSHEISNCFVKNYWKDKFDISEVGKKEETVRKKKVKKLKENLTEN